MPHWLLLYVHPVTQIICQNEVSAEQALPHSQRGSWTADQRAFRLCYYVPADGQTKDQTIDHEYCFFSNLLSHVLVRFCLVFIMISDPNNLFSVLCVLQVTFIISLPEVQAWSIWMFPEVLRHIYKLDIVPKVKLNQTNQTQGLGSLYIFLFFFFPGLKYPSWS